MATSKLQALWNHPAGPKTTVMDDAFMFIIMSCLQRLGSEIRRYWMEKLELWLTSLFYTVVHFWAPTFKWGISIANLADSVKPPEKVSYPQQIAVTATGVIWSRYSTVITPKNWNLFSVNVVMAGTGIYQLTRKIR
ncbi:hypothetical protein RD792_002693 [Penstemon davidsonii]|uniref:Mitochondrial pyruvate carrier n=1 Tax=Penstemon davidsonii TaxID=160366 RepID=A0ABR0DRS3_9LAMI|nr:hypothetical protein RD792_002693 [Penstemon davidsonii]